MQRPIEWDLEHLKDEPMRKHTYLSVKAGIKNNCHVASAVFIFYLIFTWLPKGQTYLIRIDKHSKAVTNPKDNDDEDKHPGNVLISPLSGRLPLIELAGCLDGLEQVDVENNQDEEGQQTHEDEVETQNVVAEMKY